MGGRQWGGCVYRRRTGRFGECSGAAQEPQTAYRTGSARVAILPDLPPPPMPLYIMFPAGRFLAPRIQVVVDWLPACIAPAPVD